MGIAAIIGIFLTYLSSSQSVRATDNQLKLAQQQQAIDEYTTAITDLGSSSIDVRLGGVYLLQQLMDVSASEQTTVVDVLCAFIRDQSTTSVVAVPKQDLVNYILPADIQAALSIVASRDRGHQGRAGVNLDGAQLTNANLWESNLTLTLLIGTNFTDARLNGAVLPRANLLNANLTDANLHRSVLTDANLTGANLTDANLTDANLTDANLTDANLTGAILTGATFTDANLIGAVWPATASAPAGWTRDPGTGLLERAKAAD